MQAQSTFRAVKPFKREGDQFYPKFTCAHKPDNFEAPPAYFVLASRVLSRIFSNRNAFQ